MLWESEQVLADVGYVGLRGRGKLSGQRGTAGFSLPNLGGHTLEGREERGEERGREGERG